MRAVRSSSANRSAKSSPPPKTPHDSDQPNSDGREHRGFSDPRYPAHRLRLDDERPEVSDITFALNTSLKNIPLSQSASSLGSEPQLIEIANLDIALPARPVYQGAHARQPFPSFHAGRTSPHGNRQPDDSRSQCFSLERTSSGTWTTCRSALGRVATAGLRSRLERSRTSSSTTDGSPWEAADADNTAFRLSFRTRAQDVALDNLAALRLQAVLEIPPQKYVFDSYQLEFTSEKGELRFAYPPEKNVNNLVGTIRLQGNSLAAIQGVGLLGFGDIRPKRNQRQLRRQGLSRRCPGVASASSSIRLAHGSDGCPAEASLFASSPNHLSAEFPDVGPAGVSPANGRRGSQYRPGPGRISGDQARQDGHRQDRRPPREDSVRPGTLSNRAARALPWKRFATSNTQRPAATSGSCSRKASCGWHCKGRPDRAISKSCCTLTIHPKDDGNELRQSLTLLVRTVQRLGGCKAPTVNLATSEPIKVDINMRLDVYQYSSPATQKPAQPQASPAPQETRSPPPQPNGGHPAVQEPTPRRRRPDGLLVIRSNPEANMATTCASPSKKRTPIAWIS